MLIYVNNNKSVNNFVFIFFSLFKFKSVLTTIYASAIHIYLYLYDYIYRYQIYKKNKYVASFFELKKNFLLFYLQLFK